MQVNSSPKTNIKTNSNNDIKAKIFYFNDVHGRLAGAEKLKIASDMFDVSNRNSSADIMKFTAGDIYIGQSQPKYDLMATFMNFLKLDATVLGNHPFDLGTKNLSDIIDKHRFITLATNLNTTENSNLVDDIQSNRLVRSSILEKNGHKYGLLGALPFNLKKRMSYPSQQKSKDINIDKFEQTKKELSQEIKKLKQQGVNKIILLSHMGYDSDVKIAQSVSGIDVIVGGHTHTLLKGVKSNKNYFNAPDGNPVLITQAGKNGKYYGVLDLVFDNQGRIKQALNKIKETVDVPKSSIIKYFENKILGPAETLGTLTKSYKAKSESSLTEDPKACLVADAIREKSGAEIAFMNIGGTKGGLDAGTVTDRDIYEMAPYCNKVKLYKYSEKDLIKVLNCSVKATLNPPHRTGNLQTSGLTYTIDSNMKIKDVMLENPDGTTSKLNSENPSSKKMFTVAYNSFLEGGPEHVEMLHSPEKVIKSFDWSDTDATIEYIKNHFKGEPFKLREGRFKIEKPVSFDA